MTAKPERSWFAVDIEAASNAIDAVEYALNSLDSLGNEVDQMRRSVDGNWTVTGYFDQLPEAESMDFEIHAALQIYGLDGTSIRSISTRDVLDRDWLAEWKKHWKPTVIGRFVIAPPWEAVDDPSRLVIRIEPNMAFGTGTHETTKLCLQAIDNEYRTGEAFLDVGTGTGILAIAAAKLNLRSEISNFKLLAVDTDPDSVTIARENAELNGVADNVDVLMGTLGDVIGSFDFVCANLTLDVISPILSLLVKKTRRKLVLSGILAEQEHEIRRELDNLSLSKYGILRDGEWIAVLIDI